MLITATIITTDNQLGGSILIVLTDWANTIQTKANKEYDAKS